MKSNVSIWLGKFKTIDDFRSYVSESIDEDGNISSFFMTEFGIDCIDHDKMESVYDLDIKKYFFNTKFSFSYSEQFNSRLGRIILKPSPNQLRR